MFSQQQIAAACAQYGPELLNLPPGVTGPQLLWAISGNESSFGANCTPRHEPAYDVGGPYGDGAVMKPLLALYGSAAACSYGPWQIMFCNVASGWTPTDLEDLDKAAQATVAFMNVEFSRFKPASLAEIGECWNAGHPIRPPSMPSPPVAAYVHELVGNYATVMP
jgi:hypothetical protein